MADVTERAAGWGPLPPISNEAVHAAATTLARMMELRKLRGGIVTFQVPGLTCTGWWPSEDDTDGSIDDIAATVLDFDTDLCDVEGSMSRNHERCKLEVRHAIDRLELERRLMREFLASRG